MWPEGFQRREQVQSEEEPLWAYSNFVWHSNGYRKHADSITGKAETRHCLGVFKCTVCHVLERPKTGKHKVQLDTGCACGGAFIWMKCDAKTSRYTISRDGEEYLVWEHSGLHLVHDRPPAGRLSAEQWAAVDQQVSRHHDATAFQLRNGDLGLGSVPLAKIAPKLAGGRLARYAVAKSREHQGINPKAQKGAAGTLHSFSNLANELSTPFLMDSGVNGPVYIVMFTPFMSRIIKEAIDDWILDAREGPSVGRHGFVTDGDHKFFRQGNLLVTSAWSPVITSWVPIVYTWVDRLDAEHHKPHFLTLFHVIIEHAGDNFDKKFFSHVSQINYMLRINIY